MYGFLNSADVMVCASVLQDFIDERSAEEDTGTLEVIASVGGYLAAIEVSGVVIWCSETHGHDSLTSEFLIKLFLQECVRWSAMKGLSEHG